MTDVSLTIARPLRRRRRRLAVVAGAAGLVVAGLAIALLVRTLMYRGETMPGVRLLGVGLAGESRGRLETTVPSIVGERLAWPIRVELGSRSLTVAPATLLAVNVRATADAALRAGQGSFVERAATLLSPFPRAHEVQPVLRIRRIRAGAFLVRLKRFGERPVDARVRIEGTKPVAEPARAGTAPLGNRLLADLERQVLAGGASVRVHFRQVPPRIATLAAKVAAAEAGAVLAAPVSLRFRGEQVGRLDPSQLAALIRFRPEGTGYAVTFDRAKLAAAVEPALSRFENDPKDASFAVEGGAVHVIRSQPGFRLDPGKALAAVAAAARRTSGRDAALALAPVQPELTTSKAQALGIRQQLVAYTTQMGASSSNRIHNVHLMADLIDGTVIGPGQTFSFNEVVGPRTTERGFLEGQMIIGSLTLPAIGGGVCQTATTLFNDAFETGLPILSRTNHAYYLSHYPLGRDATVSWGGPDLVFKNDLKHGILIKSSYTDSTLTFTFYGTPQGRRVVSTTGPQTSWTDPKQSYAYDPSGRVAPPGGTTVVSGSGERGFDVAVYRTVYEHGQVLRKDSFFSRYIPVGPTVVYGPGRTPPGSYVVLPSGP